MPRSSYPRVRVLSNLSGLGNIVRPVVALEHESIPYRPSGRVSLTGLVARLFSCDYVVINCSPLDLVIVAAIRIAIPFARFRLVSLDTVLPVPSTMTVRQRIALWAKRALFARVHIFIEYFRDTTGYEHYYGIPRDRFRYVPFKVNRYERVLRTQTRDDGYVFCGGNTRRDFATLIEAVRPLPYRVRIVTMSDQTIAENGSTIDTTDLPPNVEVVRHDGSDSFLEYIARARLVVLPIKKQNISASGIGVYLTSMALGKCVIISEGPSVKDILPDGAAIIVPAGDPQTLRGAIVRAYEDDSYRSLVAETGQRYARSLKGEERLCESVVDVLLADAESRQGALR